ncbi:MAG TPA: hypothetical protein VFC84_02255 [Desulfosporosinus sp.]|nr:hypothetical protein [Desulfosporosinus sp.]
MIKKTYPKKFFNWLVDNREIQNQLLPTAASYLEQYFSDESPEAGWGGMGDVVWWDLGGNIKFAKMSYEEQKLYIEVCMSKLWEEYCDENRDLKEKPQEFRVLVLDSKIRDSFGELLGYFISSTKETQIITFKELETIIGVALPSEAYRYKNWWLNPNHIYSDSWLKVGWRASEVKLGESVRFIKEDKLL